MEDCRMCPYLAECERSVDDGEDFWCALEELHTVEKILEERRKQS